MGVTFTVCTTCKPAPGNPFGSEGAQLAAMLTAAAGNPHSGPRIVKHACLWACREACVLLIEAPRKTGYLVGRFDADHESVDALLAWAEAFGGSEDGTVPYALWPEGMKGHFIARLPVGREGQ